MGGLTAGVLYLNLRVAQRGLVPYPVVLRFKQSAPQVNLTAALRRLSLPVSLAVGLLAGFAATPAWDLVLQVIYQTKFGIADPVFSRDIGFYVFTLPALSAAIGLLTTLAVLCLLLLIPLYWLRGDVVLGPRRLSIEPAAGLHLAILLAALFLLTGLAAVAGGDSRPPLFDHGPTGRRQLHRPARPAAGAAADGGTGSPGRRRRPDRRGCGGSWPATELWALGGYVAVALVGRGLFPLAMQKFVVAPTELTRETPYLRHHIVATRQAWGLDSVETRELGGEADLTLADIRANAPTIENVRLWDRDPLLQTFGQLQEIRTYYDFVSVDDDRYWIDGKYRQVLLSPRELNAASLPTRTFINEHLTFTHGMGLTLGPVNQVTTEGLPVLFVKDLPPVSTVSLEVTRPQIYYGELANEYVFVGTRQREFDHPAGEANVYAAYARHGRRPGRQPRCAASCSPPDSAPRRSCSRRTSPTTAGCSTTATSRAGRRRRCRSSGSIAIPIS